MTARPLRGAVLSGSFNPLHKGHVGLAEAAAEQSGLPPMFELPVVNADKGSLPWAEVERRVRQFEGLHPVVLTRLPLFTQKAAVFAGSVFAVGVDTARRLVDPRYYGSRDAMHEALLRIAATGCRFLVAGRLHGDTFATLADVGLPAGHEHLFEAIPADRFRVDLSSTELRRS